MTPEDRIARLEDAVKDLQARIGRQEYQNIGNVRFGPQEPSEEDVAEGHRIAKQVANYYQAKGK